MCHILPMLKKNLLVYWYFLSPGLLNYLFFHVEKKWIKNAFLCSVKDLVDGEIQIQQKILLNIRMFFVRALFSQIQVL